MGTGQEQAEDYTELGAYCATAAGPGLHRVPLQRQACAAACSCCQDATPRIPWMQLISAARQQQLLPSSATAATAAAAAAAAHCLCCS